MNKYMGVVNELIATLEAADQTKISKQQDLTKQVESAKKHLQDLHKRLDAALVSTDGEDEKLLHEIRRAEDSLRQLEDLQIRLKVVDVKHVVTPDDLINEFRNATMAFGEEIREAAAKAQEAKKVYCDALTELEQMCNQQHSFRSRVDSAARLHQGRVIDGQLPRLTVPREPYVSYHYYAERGN